MRYDYKALETEIKQYKAFHLEQLKEFDEVIASAKAIASLENFEGKFALSTKQYMQEVHQVLPTLLKGLSATTMTSYDKALKRALELVDSSPDAVIETDILKELKVEYQEINIDFNEGSQRVNKIICDVSEHLDIKACPNIQVDDVIAEMMSFLTKLENDITTLSNEDFLADVRHSNEIIASVLDKVGQMEPEKFNLGDITKMLEDSLENIKKLFTDALAETEGKDPVYRLQYLMTKMSTAVLNDEQLDWLERELFKHFGDTITKYLGFKYMANGDYYTTNEYSLQSGFGFMDFYDHLAPYGNMDIDTEIITFISGDKEYRFQLWKGKYAGNLGYGGEIGVYYRDKNLLSDLTPYSDWNPIKQFINYRCVPKQDQLPMVQKIYDKKTGKELLSNDSRDYADKGKHYWNLAIRIGFHNYKKTDLLVINEIEIKDNQLRKDYLNALKFKKNIKIEDDGTKNGGVVIYKW